MFISKQELLAQTGISYGQLYRWKREGLIPEEWFIKQPSFTGQQTVFPKEKILKRIRAIQELKDQYSLEELAKILSPEVAERSFTPEDLQLIEEIRGGLIPAFSRALEKNSFTFIEVLVFIALSSFQEDFDLQLSDVERMLAGIKDCLPQVKQAEYLCLLLEYKDDYFLAIRPEKAQVFLDRRLKPLREVRLNDISAVIKVKYRKRFNFHFEDEKETEGFFEGTGRKVAET